MFSRRLPISHGCRYNPLANIQDVTTPSFGHANAGLDVVHHLFNVDGFNFNIWRQCSHPCNLDRRRVHHSSDL